MAYSSLAMADGETVDLRGLLDKRDVAPGQFALARETGMLDFCVQRLVATSESFLLCCPDFDAFQSNSSFLQPLMLHLKLPGLENCPVQTRIPLYSV